MLGDNHLVWIGECFLIATNVVINTEAKRIESLDDA